jgi:outer membrane protein OmpA-like peptidoglycan-associated protein
MSLQKKLDNRDDTLIGIILAFAMAIGVWVYAVKPKHPTHLSTAPAAATVAPSQTTHLAQFPESHPAPQHITPVAHPMPPSAVVVESAPKVVKVETQPPLVNALKAVAPAVKAVPKAQVTVKPPAPAVSVAQASPLPAPKPIVAQEIAKPVVGASSAPVALKVAAVTATADVPPAPAPVTETPAVPAKAVAAVAPGVSAATTAPKVVIRESFEFPMGSARIPASAKARLLEGAVLLKNDPRHLNIVGHTDNIGYPEANRRLSLRRAKAVMVFLVAAGVDPTHLSVDGAGDSQPIDDNQTAAGRHRNRRIDITE